MTDQEYSDMKAHLIIKEAESALSDICVESVSFIEKKELQDVISKLHDFVSKGYKSMNVTS